ncbi:chemotaxis protein MotB [Octadecabacter temperatus]|uniref:Motility protein B n=1 Tax=Octadecabacter temperatus TaxID=1458307 RepID=A0A0K0Y2Q1_9RHOB|nr:peptidoglycan -binding protein [Octadecabacter temperatus]AKS45186.1 Motility protein B [Octadecabacter temperatus]SIN87860.1 chemotaxis protein MotB [Octadecabacter temperatus]
MALSRRTGARFQASIWPGFVDAMTGLLLVLMFVLTIFMVLQFVLRETITGQEAQLDSLSAEVLALTSALGIQQDQSAALGAQVGVLSGELSDLQVDLTESESQVAQQNAVIARLTGERDALIADVSNAQSQITGFEAQVAGLLAQRREAEGAIADLEAREAELISAQEALNLALAQARTEIDEGTEAARLAAARADALDAMIAELEADNAASATQISELEAAKLVDAAAAEALRARLANSDTELTAMTLALEEQRQQAEDTLTLLAAAQVARDELNQNLAIALLAQQEAEAAAQAAGIERSDLAERLAAELEQQSETGAGIEALQAQLAEALIARTEIETNLANAAQERDALNTDLAAAVAALAAAQEQSGSAAENAQRQIALLALANDALTQEQALSAESQRQVALLNEQVSALRGELERLQGLLNLANDEDATANVQIETLTQDLNTAMARALLAERRARVLEEAELERLAAEAVELERYRSDFLGLLRVVLEDVEGVRIEGDRFVFSSEVLFEQGAAELSDEGQREIAKVAGILRDVAGDIPEGIDWVIRVDGHTDNVPLSGQGQFANNWELSQARALSVVLYMVNFLGIPPERLAANGFGQYQPINPDNSDAARAQNRRIELKLTER